VSGFPYLVARYNTDGSLDSTFGTNGFATGGSYHSVGFVALEPDGRIVLAGYTNGSPAGFALARFLATGPKIGSFVGSNVMLTASNISDGNPGATVTQVAFYEEVNGVLTLLGYGTQTSPGMWTFTFTVPLAPGTYTLTAQAEDNYGVLGDPFALTLTV
jgi:hypothetical protein